MRDPFRRAVARSGLSATFWFICIGAFVNRAGGFVAPLLAIYLTEKRGLTIEQAGLFGVVYGLGAITTGPLGGWCADRLGRRHTLLAATILGASAMFLLGFARTHGQLICAIALHGLCSELYRAPMFAMVADVVPSVDRPRAYSHLYWAVNLGFAFAPVIGGIIATHSFFWLFVGDAMTTLALGFLIWSNVVETRPTSDRPVHERASFWTPYFDAPFVAFLLGIFVVSTIINQGSITLPIDMRRHGFSAAMFGRTLALNGVLIVFLQPFAVPILRRYAAGPIVAAGTLLMGIGYGLNVFSTTLWRYGLGVVVWTLGEIGITAFASTIAADRAPIEIRGSYQGAYQLAWSASAISSPLFGSIIYQHYGANTLWISCLVAGSAAAVLQLFAVPRLRRAKN